MAEEKCPNPLDKYVSEAVQKFVESDPDGAGMTQGFVILVDYIDAEGKQCWTAAHLDGQTLPRSAWMAKWLNDYYDSLAAHNIMSLIERGSQE